MVRSFAEVRQLFVERAEQRRHPFSARVDPVAISAVLAGLDSVEPQAWVAAFGELAVGHQGTAATAERAGNVELAAREYLLAYDAWRLARYPAPNSTAKREAYAASQQTYLKAMYWSDPPLERVWMSFNGKPGEGMFVIGDVRKPKGFDGPRPVVVHWGGSDSLKEEQAADPFLAAGMASLAVDMPGTGDAPLDGSTDAERQWDAVFDWIASQDDLDAERIGVVGVSTGGYWAAKLAHTHRDRIRAAVVHGGPIHHAFQAEWIEQAQTGEYPFELAETLAAAFGGQSYADWVSLAPRLSLLDQGILDGASAPLLVVNGVHDTVFPVQDAYVLLEHGQPKTARLLAGEGHLGGPESSEIIVDWLRGRLAA
jgi:esterase FrsA